MPDENQFADLGRKLEQLNRLEAESAMTGRSSSSAQAREGVVESLRANIPLVVLVQHDRMRARGRQSVADVKNDVCSGCHMKLPVGTLTAIKRKSTLVKCDHCGRFAFPAEEEPLAAPPPATTKKSPRSTQP